MKKPYVVRVDVSLDAENAEQATWLVQSLVDRLYSVKKENDVYGTPIDITGLNVEIMTEARRS